MSTPPHQPGDAGQGKAKPSIQQQLDRLLVEIEEVEPGTIDPKVLPKSYKPKPKPKPAPAAEAPPPAEAKTEAVPDSPPSDTADAEPTAEAATPEQAEMLAALNSALQDLGNEPDEEPAEPAAAPAGGEPVSMEDKLQQEIAALMNAEPQAAPTPGDGPAAAPAESPPPEAAATAASTEDQIAMEIEGLLNADQATDDAAEEVPAEAAIDELDKMLAQEIDADDELAGDFQSVEDLTAGIQVEGQEQLVIDDEHAATARDVAAELDSQPEDLPAPPSEPAAAEHATEPAEDPMAVLAELAETSEQNAPGQQPDATRQHPRWVRWLEVGRERLLNACYVINWPARRFLSAEWRANLGYIALLNLFFGVGLWIVLILF